VTWQPPARRSVTFCRYLSLLMSPAQLTMNGLVHRISVGFTFTAASGSAEVDPSGSYKLRSTKAESL